MVSDKNVCDIIIFFVCVFVLFIIETMQSNRNQPQLYSVQILNVNIGRRESVCTHQSFVSVNWNDYTIRWRRTLKWYQLSGICGVFFRTKKIRTESMSQRNNYNDNFSESLIVTCENVIILSISHFIIHYNCHSQNPVFVVANIKQNIRLNQK